MCACVAMIYSEIPMVLIGVKTATKTKPKLNTRQAAHNEDNFAVPEQWQDGVSNSTEITIEEPWNRDCRGGIEVDQCVLKSM